MLAGACTRHIGAGDFQARSTAAASRSFACRASLPSTRARPVRRRSGPIRAPCARTLHGERDIRAAVYDVAAWAAALQAQAFPVIAALSVFGQPDQKMTLELIGDAAGDAWRALPGQFPSR
jgi:hypothetical protein